MNDRNHPALAGLVSFAGYTAVRYYAGAYLVRTRGPEAATRFFRHAAAMILGGIGVFAAVFIGAMLVSYVSLNTAALISMLGLVAGGCTRGPLADRISATARDYFPRISP